MLSAIPVLAGTLRLVQLLGGPELMPADDRFAGFPLPLVAHIVAASTYAVVGAFQLVPRFRRNHPGWMTLFYAPKPGTGSLLYVLRLAFGSAMAACLVLGVTTVRRGDVAGHRAWMIRAYAIGLAAGTQAFTGGFGGALFGTGVVAGDLAKAAAWAINLAVAEWVIRRGNGSAPSSRPRSAARRTTPTAVPS
jgi:hypothetical protein